MNLKKLRAQREARRAEILSRVKNHDPDLAERLAAVQLDWFKVKNAAEGEDTATIYIYDEIVDSFIAEWFGFGVSAEDLIEQLNGITAKNINVRINSPGGFLFEGLAIFNALLNHPANIHVYVDALAASAASVIAMAGDTITMMPGSQMMIHDASGIAMGNPTEIRDYANFLDKQSDNIASVYVYRAGGEVKDWRALMKAETWAMASEAVDLGLADQIFTKPEQVEDPEKKDDEEPVPEEDPDEEKPDEEDEEEEDPTKKDDEEDPDEEDNVEDDVDELIEALMKKPHRLDNRGFKYSGRDKAPVQDGLFTDKELEDFIGVSANGNGRK